MFGIGWSEFLLIALVLLIFVGPKNLPPLLRKVGGIVAELKAASREFRNQLDIEVRELELSSTREEIERFGQDALRAASKPYDELREADQRARAELLEAKNSYDGENGPKTTESETEKDRHIAEEKSSYEGATPTESSVGNDAVSSDTKLEPKEGTETESQ